MSDLLKVFLVVGTRPNFMKMSPLYFELIKEKGVKTSTVHTGQHYDYEISQAFFEEFDLPKPNYFPGAGPGTHGEQTGKGRDQQLITKGVSN
jgi:UDP-N-acetylglucosamine 2-epimerase (non-hydrolysing)